MEVIGKIVRKFDLQKGVSKAGNEWQKQLYLLEVNENNSQYPKQFVFDFFGDRINQFNFEVGDTIKLSFDIESRSFNDRWYTDVRGWKAEKVDGNAPQQQPVAPQPAPADPFGDAPAPVTTDLISGNNDQDDLPF